MKTPRPLPAMPLEVEQLPERGAYATIMRPDGTKYGFPLFLFGSRRKLYLVIPSYLAQ